MASGESLPGLLEFVEAAILLGLERLCVLQAACTRQTGCPKQLQLGGARTRLIFLGTSSEGFFQASYF